MKLKSFIAALFFLFAGTAAFAAAPAVFFSDLTSGPASGGKDNKGAFVTIVGKNFGATRGTNTVSIGGVPADNYPVWSDTRISFQLGNAAVTGNITVTTPDGTSNGIPFTVRAGRIFFVDDTSPASPGTGSYTDPWRSPASYFSAMQAGDICYFRQGTYSGTYGNTSRPYNVSLYSTSKDGGPNNEIAWVGYPGETALFSATGSPAGNFEFSSSRQYYIVAGLSMYSYGDGRGAVRVFSNNNKVVNCKVEGIKTLSYGMFEVTATAGTKIWGNELFGAISQNKLDHVLYCQSGADNVDFGWNYIHDNQVDVGPLISIHEDGGSGAGMVYQNIRIHDNLFDCRNSGGAPLRALGVVDTALGGSVYFYNNTVIEAGGSSWSNGIYLVSCSVYIYNNIFYRPYGSGSSAISIEQGGTNWHPEQVEIKDNIFYNQSSCGYISNTASLATVVVANNCYYGGAGSAPSADTAKVTADPSFVNAAALNFRLNSNSPCVDKGADTTAVAPKDRDGTARAAGRIDIGAYEYLSGLVAPVTASISGFVKDAGGVALSSVTVTLAGAAARTALTDGSGFYQFADLAVNSAYTITPAKSGWTFNPVSLAMTLAANLVNQNFTGTANPPAAYAINGYVRDAQGSGISGATVTLSGGASRTATTTSTGFYEFTGLAGGSAYTVAPSKSGMTFAPASISVASLGGILAEQNFTGTPVAPTVFVINGYVRDGSGAGIAGTVVTLSGSRSLSTTAAADGFYQFSGIATGDYAVTPSSNGWNFSPVRASITSLAADWTSQNFTGTPVTVPVITYSVGGYIRDAAGSPVGGASVILSGGASQTTATSPDGHYGFAGLAAHQAYTITPAKTKWKFNPASIAIADLSADTDNRNFTATRLLHIRGHVKTSGTSSLAGAQMVLNGDAAGATVTDANGYYEFTDLPESGSYAVRSLKTGYAFSPSLRSTPALTDFAEAWDFEAAYVSGILSEGEVKVIGSTAGRGTINPDRGEVPHIYFKGARAGTYECRIFSLQGELAWENSRDNVQEGMFSWDAKGFASGIYIANVRGPGMDVKKKIAILR